MTEAKLEKEAEVYVKNLLEGTEFEDDEMDVCAYTKREMLEAILHFSEPREKRIAELERQLSAMEKGTCDVCKVKDAEFYEKRIEELETRCNELFFQVNEQVEQIEKMKCCSNCDNWNWKHNKCEKKLKGDCFKASKWILRR